MSTVGSTCSSIRGKQKYSPGGKRRCTSNLGRRSHPSRRDNEKRRRRDNEKGVTEKEISPEVG
jgi:hypothetical protein